MGGHGTTAWTIGLAAATVAGWTGSPGRRPRRSPQRATGAIGLDSGLRQSPAEEAELPLGGPVLTARLEA